VVFEWNPHPRKPLPAKPTSPHRASIKEMCMVAANVRHNLKQTIRLTDPKRLNASTDWTALA
jgi:hypothetical protein